jgi:hypothetical protein
MFSTEKEALSSLRRDLYATFRSWGDALFELCDALVCTPGPVTSLPALSLEPEFSRSHGSLYKALERGSIDADALRALLVAARPREWPAVFAVDASTVERCDAECSPERGFYYSASRHSAGQPIVAGWHYQWICQLSWAPDSWTAPVDVCRIPPAEDPTAATVAQLCRLVASLPSSSEVPLFVLDAGYDPIAIGHDLCGEGCEIVCRIRTTGSSTRTHHRSRTDGRRRGVARHATEDGGSAPTQRAGRSRPHRFSPPTPATGRSRSPPGTTCTRAFRGAATGLGSRSHRSCAAR